MTQLNPYHAPRADVHPRHLPLDPHDTTNLEARKAGRGVRFAGVVLDGILPTVLFVAAGLALGISFHDLTVPDGLTTENGHQLMVAVYAILGGYMLLTMVLLAVRSQSIGKIIVGTKIVATNGAPVGIGRSFFLRTVLPGAVQFVPFLGALFSIVDALFIFRADRRCLHDHIAGTIVVTA